MIGLVALLVVAGLAVVLWRTVAAGRGHRDDALPRPQRPARGSRRRMAVPPDDDPEFLAELSRRARGDDEPG